MRNNKKIMRFLVLSIAIALSVALAYCNVLSDPTVYEKASTSYPQKQCIDNHNNANLVETTSIGLLKCGELHYTLSNARLVNDIGSIPVMSGFLDDAACIFPGKAESAFENASVYVDELIQADGTFIPGAYLLLVDLTVTSHGAKAYTLHDLDEEGYPMGQFAADNLFHIDHIINLSSTPQYDPDETLFYCLSYYSEKNSQAEHPLIFKLNDGESISVTIGFLVDDINFGGRFNLEKIALCDIMGDPNAAYVELNLRGN